MMGGERPATDFSRRCSALRAAALGVATLALSLAVTTVPGAAQSWTLTKTATPTTYTAVGQVITYTYRITNTVGDGTLTSLTDSIVTNITCPTNAIPENTTLTCTGTYVIQASDVVPGGSVTNTATAIGDACNDGCITSSVAQATVTFVPQPSWTLAKTPNPSTYSAAGQTISYSYSLTNTGNVSISAVSVTDDKVGSVTCQSTTLATGASTTCSGAYVTTAADVTAGSITNTATATGTPAAGTLAPATAQATVTRVASAGSITIIKTANGGNGSFNFTSTVAGASAFTLATVGGAATRVFTNLTPGTYTVTEINLPLNWKLSSLACTGDAGGTATTVNLANRSVSIGLDSGESITCTFANAFDAARHIGQTQQAIALFLAHRVRLLASHEPDRSRFIRRLPGSLWGDDDSNPGTDTGGPFGFAGSSSPTSSRMSFTTSIARIAQAHADAEAKGDQVRAMAFAGPQRTPPRRSVPRSAFDVWIEAHFSEFKSDAGGFNNKGHFGLVYLGADYLVTQSVLVGALVQFDKLSETSRSTNTAANGWGAMAGPYVSMRLTPHIFFDARAAWGTSRNTIDPFGLYQDDFSTTRWLSHAKLTGNWRFGNVRVTPSAGVTYVSEKQRSYVDPLGVFIPGQTVSLGQFAVGPELAYRYLAASGAVYEPHVSIEGVWDFDRPNVPIIAGVPISDNELHARVKAGLMARTPSGTNIRAVASYDGLGSDRFRAIGAQLWLNIPLR
ncbi:MAG: DUF7507 domain-containing protein [Xanthobacteraceae bacterium]